MAGTDLDPERRLTPEEALAQAIDRAVGNNGWRANLVYDADEQTLTLVPPVGDPQPIIIGASGGKSAYQTALDQGFAGTVAEWLASLIGKSAYQNAVENGFTGTAAEWAALIDPPVVEITASRPLAAADLYRRLRGNSASAITVTIPTDATADLALSPYPVENVGAGILTVSVEVGATLNGVDGGSVSLARYQAAAIEKIGANTWIVPNAEVI